MYRILLVCLGNICRSPLAEAVFHDVMARRGLASMLKVDSAAIGRSHLKEKPDRRAIACALSRGYRHIEQIRSRPVKAQDFLQFDLILAMDNDNLLELQRRCPSQLQHKLQLFMQYHPRFPTLQEVPDPYYGGGRGFARWPGPAHQAGAAVITGRSVRRRCG